MERNAKFIYIMVMFFFLTRRWGSLSKQTPLAYRDRDPLSVNFLHLSDDRAHFDFGFCCPEVRGAFFRGYFGRQRGLIVHVRITQ